MNHSYKNFSPSRLIYFKESEFLDSSNEKDLVASNDHDLSDPEVVKGEGEGFIERIERNSLARQARRRKNRAERRKDQQVELPDLDESEGAIKRFLSRIERNSLARQAKRRANRQENGVQLLGLLSPVSPNDTRPYEKLVGKQIETQKRKGITNASSVLVERLIKDPSLKNMPKVRVEWLDELVVKVSGKDLSLKDAKDLLTEKEFEDYCVNAQAVIARNLYFQYKPVTEFNVREELIRLAEVREEYKNVHIFKGRNVLLVAHNEVIEWDSQGDSNRFIKKSFELRIESDHPKELDVLRGKESLLSLTEKKYTALEKIETAESPFTFVFDGHGGPNKIYLSSGKISNGKLIESETAVKITVRELFRSYKVRQEKYPSSKDPAKKDIFINSGCYSANFIRSFYNLCDKFNVPKPIFAGESEYGQFGYSEYASLNGDKFFDAMFDYSDSTPATLGNLINHDIRNPSSNISIYIPDDENVTMQLTENERQSSQDQSGVDRLT